MSNVTPYRVQYDSVEDIWRVADKHWRDGTVYDGEKINSRYRRDWVGGIDSLDALRDLAVNGWAEAAPEALDLAQSSVTAVEKTHDMPTFHPVWDVTGAEVDVARYLDGEPENMIDYEQVSVPRSGRVITLVSGVSVSGSVSAASIKRRGVAVAALAIALSRMRLSIEIWADMTSYGNDGIRTLVKGANDELDVARIMFALAHPGMMRALCMPAMHDWPEAKQQRHGVGGDYGFVHNPYQDMPEGTIYLPAVRSSVDVPDADIALMGYLRQLGIVT